ncbi:MAG: D-alanine--D-alanine ligase [Alphaproteobacteria bacterium]|nr:D-alanine--D-alanine ligase [Alphaproteobacteria bacterium SS10]
MKTMPKGTEVAVLLGGWSAEREVSLVSGAAIADALEARGHKVRRVDVTRDIQALHEALTPKPDVAFNALHGEGGEDGVIQGVLEMMGVPYTHSGISASAMAMKKPGAKRVASFAGLNIADAQVLSRAEIENGGIELKPPYVIKPASEGSSVGISIVHPGQNDLKLEHGDPDTLFLVEDFIPGHELTVGVMGDRALAVTEIFHEEGFFDYHAKYTEGVAHHVIPAKIPTEIEQAAKEQALAMHQALGCRGVTRTDFRWDDTKPSTDGLVFLEINTQPGFTPISLVPEQAEHIGISFGELCEWLMEDALCRV